MADPTQVERLTRAKESWNEWRRQNPDVKIDLADVALIGADLSQANLRGADLSKANLGLAKLGEADLREADLSEADLCRADLRKADLGLAKLRGADLSEADFGLAKLGEADLRESDLREADLSQADLRKADLGLAKLRGADLSKADLSEASLSKANLTGANLQIANLRGADLWTANLIGADLRGADLRGANLRGADLWTANLIGADLREADLSKADLTDTDLRGANLCGADLSNVHMVNANISDLNISESKIYGISVWDLKGEFREQKGLVITPKGESAITVDNIKVAQFIYLLLNNKEIRDVINTLTSKTVLILGRFSIPERKAILDALRNKLREYDLLPIVFDFDRPLDKDLTETIKTLAGISYFVIADVTNPKSSPLELQATVPDYQVPFVPIIQEGEQPFSMMAGLQTKYNWVLDTISYDSVDTLMELLKPHIIDPAIKMHDELRKIKANEPTIISGRALLGKG